MESNRKLTSNFANPIGIGILAAMAVLFYYNGLNEAAGTFLLFFFLFLAAWLWNRFALSRLDIQIKDSRVCAFPGSTFQLSCKISNRKFLPLMWVEVLFPLPKNGCVEPADEENSKMVFEEASGEEVPGACARLSWLLWHQESQLDIPLKAVRRGICTFTRASAASGDGFGLGAKEKSVSLDIQPVFVVYPAVMPVQINDLTQSTSDTEAGHNGYLEDITLLKMNRVYQPGDPVKKVNWRQLAGQNIMMTNIYETIFPKMMTFLLDLSSFRTYTSEKNNMTCEDIVIWTPLSDELEEMISITASSILRLADTGICCGLIIPGLPDQNAVIHYPARHGSDPENLLYSLASVSYRDEEAVVPYDRLMENAIFFGTFCIITYSFSAMTISTDVLAKMDRTTVIACSVSDKDPFCPWKLIRKDDLTGIQA